MTTQKTDLQKAFQWARGRYMSGAGAWGNGRPPVAALAALVTARAALAALPALEALEEAAGAALEAQRAIDGRQYAPGMEAARAGRDKAAAAARAGRAWRYSGPIWTRGYPHNGPRDLESFWADKSGGPLRNMQEAGAFLDSRSSSVFYCDSFQDNTCGGYIAQLPSRNGRARFVAGFGFSHDEAGACFDLSEVFESDFEGERESARRQIGKAYWTPDMNRAGYWAESAHETARKEAARRAADLAERAAEKESEYQEAWQAGSQWARLKEEEAEERREALAILKERRAAGRIDAGAFPALCSALRGTVESLLESIREKREERAELQSGADHGEGRGPFMEGAGLQSFPDDSAIWRAVRALRAGQSGAAI